VPPSHHPHAPYLPAIPPQSTLQSTHQGTRKLDYQARNGLPAQYTFPST